MVVKGRQLRNNVIHRGTPRETLKAGSDDTMISARFCIENEVRSCNVTCDFFLLRRSKTHTTKSLACQNFGGIATQIQLALTDSGH